MVNKITKKRLKTFIQYDAVKALLAAVLACVFFVLVFNGFGKQPSDGQSFKVIVDANISIGEDFVTLSESLKHSDNNNDGFSYEILSYEKINLYGTDETPAPSNLLTNYVPLSYDDVCVLTQTVLDVYLKNGCAKELNQYINEALIYTSQFLVNGEFDEQKVYNYFDSTRGKDVRFKTAEQKQKGKENELKRIKAIYNNATALKECFEKHPELLYNASYELLGETFEGAYAINFGKLVGKDGAKAENLFNTNTVINGNEEITTTDGIFVVVGDTYDKTGDLFFEPLAFLVNLIKSYTNYLG